MATITPVLTNFNVARRVYGTAPFDLTNPVSTNTNPAATFTFTSSNVAVADISGRTVTIVNAGQAIISFNESKEQSPEITQIPRDDHDSYYQTLNDDITRTILSSHRVSSAELFGIATAGKLGGSDEIVQHSEYFRKMVIQPYQKQILPVFNKLLSLKFEKPTTLEVKPLSLFLTGDVQEQPVVDDKPITPTQI